MDRYNPNTIINEANESFLKNDIANAQMTYQCALLDWVDDAREMMNNNEADNNNSSGGVVDMKYLRDAIVLLWIEYAQLNQKANMVRLSRWYFACVFIFIYLKLIVYCIP